MIVFLHLLNALLFEGLCILPLFLECRFHLLNEQVLQAVLDLAQTDNQLFPRVVDGVVREPQKMED